MQVDILSACFLSPFELFVLLYVGGHFSSFIAKPLQKCVGVWVIRRPYLIKLQYNIVPLPFMVSCMITSF